MSLKLKIKHLYIANPSLITAILLRASGTETPAATKVRPITVSGIPRVLPIMIENISMYDYSLGIFPFNTGKIFPYNSTRNLVALLVSICIM